MSDFKGNPNCFKEAVCIEAQRIYDSCSDKDCLEDLEVIFTDGTTKTIIENAAFIKSKCVEVVNTYFTIEPVPSNKGFYSIDITYIFNVVLEAFTSATTPPQTCSGTTQFCKKVILYGSDGNAKLFSSDDIVTPTPIGCGNQNLPTATVQVVEPIVLDCKLVTKSHHHHGCHDCCCPPEILQEGTMPPPHPPSHKEVFITVGMFSIISLQRPVSMLIPAYDFCIPHKDCSTSNDSPCELFEKIKFPADEFFPPSLDDVEETTTDSNQKRC